MADTQVHTSGGIGVCGATFIVFLVLKLLGHITWSWWWVTAPLWGPVVLALGIGLIVLIFVMPAGLLYGTSVHIARKEWQLKHGRTKGKRK
jgi:hypothetical protein